ncbi:MAG: binding-protein-dependent transport system inner rane component, partial [Firmicutes bacterium]|nr:binding-protein-dependent transport system inner rane component [Bacillota bacterium]
ILERLEPTALLTAMSALVALAIGIPAGVIAAVRRNSWVDQVAMFLATLGVSIPGFWLGLNLILLLGVQFQWLPVAGYASLAQKGLGALRYLVLPALSLGVIEAGLIARMTRSSMLEVMRHDYIRTARAKGLPERVVIFRHAFRSAAIPIITVIGNTIAVLMGGAIVIETVFNIPGLGRLVIQSVLRRDYPLIQGAVLFIAVTYVLINLVVDVAYVQADPRIRYS